MKQEYRPALSLYETQSAIGAVKQIFQEQLARRPVSYTHLTLPTKA